MNKKYREDYTLEELFKLADMGIAPKSKYDKPTLKKVKKKRKANAQKKATRKAKQKVKRGNRNK